MNEEQKPTNAPQPDSRPDAPSGPDARVVPAPEARPRGETPGSSPATPASPAGPAAPAAPASPAVSAAPSTAPASTDGLLAIEEFARLDLRVARVLAAARHPNADRLLVLRIDLGGEERQLVAGIASNYQPDELVGRSIVVVANLKPARLRGEVSQGMLLAASSGEIISLLTPDKELPPGSRIR